MTKVITRYDKRIKHHTQAKYKSWVEVDGKTLEPLTEVPASIADLYRTSTKSIVGIVSFEGYNEETVTTIYRLVIAGKARIYSARFAGWVGSWRLI